jgi:hypothetical protein
MAIFFWSALVVGAASLSPPLAEQRSLRALPSAQELRR